MTTAPDPLARPASGREVLALRTLDRRLVAEARRRHPGSGVVLAAERHGLMPNLDLLAAFQGRLVIADEISESTAAPSLGEVVSLSSFDRRLWNRHRRTVKGEEKREARHPGNPVLFCPSNDTHVRMFAPILKHLPEARFLYFDSRPEERALEELARLEIAPIIGGAADLARLRPSLVVLGNDWYEPGRELVAEARLAGVPSVCLQEGCLDFSTRGRMQYSDYALVLGPVMLDHLPHRAYVVTGNPRFDELRPIPRPRPPVVMVNANFTYGVFESSRDGWIREVIEACQGLGVEFFISRHPRDRGDYAGFPVRESVAEPVHDQLVDSSVVVTRFSTLVYEALSLGRAVVYYNPHGERMRLFNEDSTGAILKPTTPAELATALVSAVQPESLHAAESATAFLERHCGPRDGGAAARCAAAFRLIASRWGTALADKRIDQVAFSLRRAATRLRRSTAGYLSRGPTALALF